MLNFLVALISGAGGSALLELFWKPRRDRRRTASLLLAEIALNTELLLLHAHSRVSTPRAISPDLRLSTMAWDATAQTISELPPKLVRTIVTLYNRYDAINRQVPEHTAAMAAYDTAQPSEMMIRDLLAAAIRNVINTGVDAAIKDGQHILKELMVVANWKEDSEERAEVVDYAQVAAKHMQSRKEQLGL